VNLVLIGYRGTGKSTVAGLLAKRLSLEVFATDQRIEEISGASIPEIVERHGWERFRDLESEVISGLTGLDGLIVDTGGGAVLRPENVNALRGLGPVFLLEAGVPTIVARIEEGDERPSLTGTKSFVDEVGEVLADRLPLYHTAADHVIDAEGSPAATADAIVALLQASQELRVKSRE